jgi:hypothetical protein
MVTMKKILLLLVLFSCMLSIAGVKNIEGYSGDTHFYQFTHFESTNTGDYHDSGRADQNWLGAQMISLNVPAKMDVWLSNYVNSWYAPIPALDGNIYQMGEGQYGAWQLDGDKTWVGNSQTTTITFTDGAGHDNSTDAYFLGHFEGGENIAVWMTTLADDGGEQVDMHQYVYDTWHGTTLVSRLDGTHDLADNVRINFGIESNSVGYIGREWVAVGVYDEDDTRPTGQPLPALPVSCALMLGTMAVAKKIKARFSKVS